MSIFYELFLIISNFFYMHSQFLFISGGYIFILPLVLLEQHLLWAKWFLEKHLRPVLIHELNEGLYLVLANLRIDRSINFHYGGWNWMVFWILSTRLCKISIDTLSFNNPSFISYLYNYVQRCVLSFIKNKKNHLSYILCSYSYLWGLKCVCVCVYV